MITDSIGGPVARRGITIGESLLRPVVSTVLCAAPYLPSPDTYSNRDLQDGILESFTSDHLLVSLNWLSPSPTASCAKFVGVWQ